MINNTQGFALWDPLSDKMLKENDFSKVDIWLVNERQKSRPPTRLRPGQDLKACEKTISLINLGNC